MKTKWAHPVNIDFLQNFSRHTLAETLGIEFTQIGEDFIEAKMPVDARTHQPFGLLHGGASVALSETLGSVAANLCVDGTKYQCVGIEVNANHLRSVSSGWVTGRATALHVGRSIQVWETRIADEAGNLVCVSRLTVKVQEKRA